MSARHVSRRLAWTPERSTKPETRLRSRSVIRFFFPMWNSGYTADAGTVAEAMVEVTKFLASCYINDPGPVDLYIDGVLTVPAHAA